MTFLDAFLARLDRERSSTGTRSATGVRTVFSHDGRCCAVVDGRCAEDRIDAVIRDEIARADAQGYTIDWKVYGHDQPSDLRVRLVAAGFEPEPVEQLLAQQLDAQSLEQFPTQPSRTLHSGVLVVVQRFRSDLGPPQSPPRNFRPLVLRR
jgi:hypothetical protein